MTTYTISNQNSGVVLGTWEADTEDQALDMFAQDAGYRDFADAADTLGQSVEDARNDLLVEVE